MTTKRFGTWCLVGALGLVAMGGDLLASPPPTPVAAQDAKAELEKKYAAIGGQDCKDANALFQVAQWAEQNNLKTDSKRLLRLAATHATQASAQTVDACYRVGGGSTIWQGHPLQRVFQDMHVATQHGAVAAATLEVLGRMAFGLPTDTHNI